MMSLYNEHTFYQFIAILHVHILQMICLLVFTNPLGQSLKYIKGFKYSYFFTTIGSILFAPIYLQIWISSADTLSSTKMLVRISVLVYCISIFFILMFYRIGNPNPNFLKSFRNNSLSWLCASFVLDTLIVMKEPTIFGIASALLVFGIVNGYVFLTFGRASDLAERVGTRAALFITMVTPFIRDRIQIPTDTENKKVKELTHKDIFQGDIVTPCENSSDYFNGRLVMGKEYEVVRTEYIFETSPYAVVIDENGAELLGYKWRFKLVKKNSPKEA